MGAALIRMVIWDQYPPTTPSLSESVSAVLLSVSDFFVQKYLVQYQLLLWRSVQIRHYLANKETKVQLRINEHEDAFKHIRWTSSITVFSFSSLFFWQAISSVQSWSLRHVTITIYSHLMYNYYAIHPFWPLHAHPNEMRMQRPKMRFAWASVNENRVRR